MLSKYLPTRFKHVYVLNLSRPLYAQMELTSVCNYRCRMCYNIWHAPESNSSIGSPLSEDEHLRIIDLLGESLFGMTFSGGEPTLVSWLPRLVARCSMYNIESSLITNGALVTSSLANSLVSAGLSYAQVSLHHFEESKNASITGIEDSFTRTLSGAQNLLKVFGGAMSVGISMVATEETYRDVYHMGSFLNREGFTNFSVALMSYSGRAIENNLFLNRKQFLEMHSQLENLQKDFDMSVGFVGGFPRCILPENSTITVHNVCDAGLAQMVIAPDGTCRPCVEKTSIGGNILTESLQDIWQSEAFHFTRNFEDVPDECADCLYVSECRGGCRASAANFSGNARGPDPLMMEV